MLRMNRRKVRGGRWPRWARLALLSGALVSAGLAGAQIALSRLNLAGQQVQSVTLYGAEYVTPDTLGTLLTVQRDALIVRVKGFGHTMLLPIDEDQRRAVSDYNTVQLDAARVKARTATFINGSLYLPVDTVARGLGARYELGQLVLAQPVLQSVSSRAGASSDRLVLDLNRDVTARAELRGTQLRIILKSTQARPNKYSTRGAFVPTAEVVQQGSDAIVSLTLPQNSGYQVYPVVRAGGTRIVVDVGPGIRQDFPAILERVGKPLIVLDPVRVEGMGRDVTLEVARRAARLLTEAGWQVRTTRDQGTALGLNQKLRLARQSDVYLGIDMGRFPGTQRGGVTVYEAAGRGPSQFVQNVRNNPTKVLPYGPLVVGDTGGSRRLSELMRGELRSSGVSAEQGSLQRLLALSEAPQAALMLEIGWTGSATDRANLGTEARVQALAVATARSVATYLTARANNASQPDSAAVTSRTILTGMVTPSSGSTP